jgi:hypothetical protein
VAGPRPTSFACGFCALEPETEVAYKVSDYYDPALDRGTTWNDAELALPQPVAAHRVALLDKDRLQPTLRDMAVRFGRRLNPRLRRRRGLKRPFPPARSRVRAESRGRQIIRRVQGPTGSARAEPRVQAAAQVNLRLAEAALATRRGGPVPPPGSGNGVEQPI